MPRRSRAAELAWFPHVVRPVRACFLISGCPGGLLVSGVDITRANPLDHAGGIKRLFLPHDRPEFPAFFDRAYPGAVRSGASSWIGLDADQRVVMHIGQFPHRF